MKTELKRLEISSGPFTLGKELPYQSVDFVLGTAQFNMSSRSTPHGVVYDCDFRFVQSDKSTISPDKLSLGLVYRLTFDDRTVYVGRKNLLAKAVLESIEPKVWRVKYTSDRPF